jgi:hypothetical protein
VAEQTLVLVQAVAKTLILRPLITAWNAARVPLGRPHALSALVESPLFVSFLLGTVQSAALRLFANRGHRSSLIEACLQLSP